MTAEALRYYAVLGVPATATVDEIKARYKTLLAEARSKIRSRQIDSQAIAGLREAYLALSDSDTGARDDRGSMAQADVPQKHVLSLVDMDVGEAVA